MVSLLAFEYTGKRSFYSAMIGLTQRTDLISRIIEWAKNNDSIRTILLIGSLARAGKGDILSDVDLSIFTPNIPQFTNNHSWINRLSTPLIILPEKVSYYSHEYPTRLVIFENGVKVDFAFFDIDLLKRLVEAKKLPPEYNAGYRVLIDKDKMTASMSKAQGFSTPVEAPNEKQFLSLIEEFWFEAYHVTKYSKRGDLWPLKFRTDWVCHGPLLKMIEWNAQAKRDWRFSPQPSGKDMQSWVDEQIWEELKSCFASFDVQESCRAFQRLMELFRRLAKETADLQGYAYPGEVDRKISEFWRTCLPCVNEL